MTRLAVLALALFFTVTVPAWAVDAPQAQAAHPPTEPQQAAPDATCFQQCVNACSIRSGAQTVDNCTGQCTVSCSRNGGKIPLSNMANMAPIDRFGAIAISPSTLLYASVKGFLSRGDAEQSAIDTCKQNPGHPSDCQIAIWFHGTCGSLAIKDDFARQDWGWGADWAQTSQAAEAQAIRNCNNHVNEKNCIAVSTLCAQ